jgi:hypothetical protein
MSLTLHLGVVDIPYTANPPSPGKGRRKKAKSASNVTTGDVAEFLENKYHVMETFFEINQQKIADQLTDSMSKSLDSLLMGSPPGSDLFGSATTKIYDEFQQFIDLKVMDTLGYPGVPTKASIKGVRSRFKKRLDPGRPSFQDSGVYENNFAAWVD